MAYLGFLASATLVLAIGAERSPALQEAKDYERSLGTDAKKLRLRHNLERLVRLWKKAREEAQGDPERRATASGELRARRLLAHWSGLDADKKSAQALEEEGRPKPEPKVAKRREVEAEPAWLEKLAIEVEEDGLVVVLPDDARLTVKKEVIPENGPRSGRVVLDVAPLVASKAALRAQPVDHAGIERIRVGQQDARTVRLVFDLARGQELPTGFALDGGRIAVRPKSAPIAEVKPEEEPKKPAEEDSRAALDRLVAQLQNISPAALPGTTRAPIVAEPEPTPEPVAEAAPEPSVQSVTEPLPELGTDARLHQRTKDALKPRPSALVRVRRVVIDAGHGGKDYGASGKRKTREKDVNLAIAEKLGAELERMGIEVSYTRRDDRFISLRRRTEIAQKAEADLFVSIHANAHRRSETRGIETYFLNTGSSHYSTRLAQRENGVAGADEIDGDPREPASDDDALPPGDLGRDLRLLLADLAMRSASDESRRLAGFVQSTLISDLARRHERVDDLGVKHALFYVLLGVRMPSILVESGFLSNPEEEERLGDPTYQQRVAAAIAGGIRRFIVDRDRVARQM